ncbi:2-methylcitrate synthase [Acidimicrobiia bacterium]|nr:2-methylcitrate synthase [Acidimicrobiia bacterium]
MDYSPGLRGVIAGETEISTVGMEGTSLRYRGYDAVGLTSTNTYEDVASLIIDDDLDGELFKKSFSNHYKKLSDDAELIQLINRLKTEQHPMDVIRTAISYIGEADESNKLDAASKVTAIACLAIASYNKESSDVLDQKYTVASSLLPNSSTEQQLEALDDMLILYAEHGFNASTFAARVTASTRSDLISAIVSGVGTLKGELHGGANEAAVELINSFNTSEDANNGVYRLLEDKKKIMGFGHGVYKIQDPRSPVVKNWVDVLSTSDESINKYEVAKTIDSIMDSEKKLFPNVDFYGGLLLSELGFAVEVFTPIFVAGRSVGWSAHYFEQKKQDTLIRPAAKYTGIQER